MNKKFSKLSLEILKSFIDLNKDIIKIMIDPYEFMKYGDVDYRKYYSVCYRLKRNGFLKEKKIKNKKIYQLTNKGKRITTELFLENKIKNKKWDKKWRILIFDIPERKRRFRDNLRKTLISIGFRQLQKSVWIFPYDVINYLYDIIPGFREGDWFQYIEANKISSQDKMKDWFGL